VGRALVEAFFPGEIAGDVVRAGDDGRVEEVVVRGRIVVRDGRLLTGDVEEIRAHAREEAARLWGRMGSL
jgi:hypothetical protein